MSLAGWITLRSRQTSEHDKSLQLIMAERTNLPWEEWQLDLPFLQSLSSYSKEHPERKLGSMLDQIYVALERAEDYIGLIPDSPFPAQNLVKALVCLLKLGITVKRAQKDAYGFAKDAVRWVEQVQSAFDGAERDSFNIMTWRSLWNVRCVINEICVWAHSRLEDRRWTRIKNGFRMGKEIDDFKARLAEAKELFRDLSILHLQVGMGAMFAWIKSIVFGQDAILDEIRKIRRDQRDQLAYIIYEVREMKEAQVRKAFLEKRLKDHTVSSPGYDAQGKYPCDQGTRENELAEIKQWLHSISTDSQNFLWLTGDPGCGKSAITASIAAHCKEEGILWAQFFISRNKKETTDPNSFFPTIASQLADFSPEVECAIREKLEVKSTLGDRITSDQAARLFVDALGVAATLNCNKVVAVIIDGLDETKKACLYDTAVVFSGLFKSLTRYPNVKVFMSSRTDDDILNPFTRQLDHASVKRIHLDTSSSINDVAWFLRKEVEKIVERYNLKWEQWPTEEGMVKMAARASGLFIWAITAAKYIHTRIDEDGVENLEGIVDELTGVALQDINNLYTLVLHSSYIKDGHMSGWDYEKFRCIIGSIVFIREPLCIDELEGLLNLHGGPKRSRADTKNLVRRLRTVLVNGTDAVDGKTIPRLHKSFVEFITNTEFFASSSLDKRFCISPSETEADLALRCLRRIMHVFNGKEVTSSGGLEYATKFYISHANSVMSEASESTALVLPDPSANVEDVRTRFSTVRQGGQLVPWFSSDLDGLFPLSFYPLTIACQVKTDKKQSNKPFAKNQRNVSCLAYSPKGEQLVSASYDYSLKIWDIQTGKEVSKLSGHTLRVTSVTFSPSGNRIASSSADRTVLLWNVATGEIISTFRGHSNWVRTVAFSSNENFLASGSDDQTVRLWDVHPGNLIGSPFKHYNPVFSVIFTPDGNLVSGTLDGFVYLWDSQTGECRQKLTTLLSRIFSVAISPLGNRLLATGSGGICFWTRNKESFDFDDKLSFESGKRSNIFQAAFSSDGESVVVVNTSSTKHKPFLYDLRTRAKIPISVYTSCHAFALSPDGLFIAFSSYNEISVSSLLHLSPLSLAALSPNGDIVVCVFSDRSLWLGSPKELPLVSKQLEGQVDNVKYLSFTSDNTLLAAVDDETIHLWDVPTQKLRGSASTKNLSPVVSLSFQADRYTVISSHEDGIIHTWKESDGTLHPQSIDTPCDMAFDLPLLPDVEEVNVRDIASARWFPSKKGGSGLWAYVDDCLVRAREDGSITILSLSPAVPS